MGEPPGGPPDVAPPQIVWVRPESGSITPDLHGDFEIQYDEVIDEQPGTGAGGRTGGPVTGLASRVILSPVVGPVNVSWHRSTIGVKPKEGWKPDRVYHLQILPGITDLRRNVQKQSRLIVFSTGPAIPSATLSGMAVMWMEQHVLTNGVIRAARLPDSAAYLVLSDSLGRFRFEQIPPGRYLLTAIADQNNNRLRDPREAFDTATVTLDTAASTTLWAFVHDTTGPRLQSLDPVDSATFRMTFSMPLDPYRPIDSLKLRLLALPDSTPVPVAAVLTSAQYDSVTKREHAVTDSLRQDSLARAAPKDTTHKADTTKARVRVPPRDTSQHRPGLPGGVGPGAEAPGRGRPASDSTTRLLLAQRPVPQDKLVVRLAKGTLLQPEAKYFVEVAGAVNLNGAMATSHNLLVIPKPKPPAPAPKDTSHAAVPRDSTRP